MIINSSLESFSAFYTFWEDNTALIARPVPDINHVHDASERTGHECNANVGVAWQSMKPGCAE